MKYFNRHQCMSTESRESILESINELHLVDGTKIMGVQNMLYGLFDGFDYSARILEHQEMELIKAQNEGLFKNILEICKEVQSYPKYDRDVTEH